MVCPLSINSNVEYSAFLNYSTSIERVKLSSIGNTFINLYTEALELPTAYFF